MGIQIAAVGGYTDIGRNCTAVNIDGEVVLLDLGLHIEHYINYTEDEDIIKVDLEELTKVGAIPDISLIWDWNKNVRAIIPSHAHLDHIGAIPFIGGKFNAMILGTPFTNAVIKTTMEDEKIIFKNNIKTIQPNSYYKLSENIKVEFINVTHSIPQTVIVALHTKYGVILYAVDFKFDRSPVLGKKTNLRRLEELGKQGVLALILDSTNATNSVKTPSENVAKQMLKDVILGTTSKNNVIVVTTFSSHIARLKSVVECGRNLNRKIIFLGRSLYKYSKAAETTGIINFSKNVEILKYNRQIKKRLKNVENNRSKFLLVTTGHQGEPKSVLSKMLDRELHFNFKPNDHIIFSCKVIPTETNIKNREMMEEKLKLQKVRIFKDIHVSGHAGREDLRDLINLVKPKHIIPAHGTSNMIDASAELGIEMGYTLNKDLHKMRDGDRLIIN